MLEHENVIMKGRFSTQTTIIRRPLIHAKLHYNLTYCLKRNGTHQEPHESVRQKFFHQRTVYLTERIRVTILNLMWKWVCNSIILFQLSPAVQNTIFVSIRSLVVSTTTAIECLTQNQ